MPVTWRAFSMSSRRSSSSFTRSMSLLGSLEASCMRLTVTHASEPWQSMGYPVAIA